MPVSLASSSAASMHGAMVPVSYSKLTSSQNIILFSNIPQNYQDLFCVVSGRSDGAYTTGALAFYLNTDLGVSTLTGYSATNLIGMGSTATSYRQTTSSPTYGLSLADGTVVPAANSTAGVFGSYELHILNYANTSTFKTGIIRAANDLNGSGTTGLAACLWQNTSAISSIVLGTNANWVAGTTFTLYGIRAVSS